MGWEVDGTSEVLRRWEELKCQEKGEERSVLDFIPAALDIDALKALWQEAKLAE